MPDECLFATPDLLQLPEYVAEFDRMLPLAEKVREFWKRTDTSRAYRWPYNPLIEWSRRLEYPYCAHALAGLANAHVLDAGSGVTFFPFYLASQKHCTVECADVVPEYGAKLQELGDALKITGVKFQRAALGETLPYPDGHFDASLCVSVLEHLPRDLRVNALRELWRVVRKGGRVVITCDLAREVGADGLSYDEIDDLVATAKSLGSVTDAPQRVADRELLTPQNPGYGLCPQRVFRNWVVRKGMVASLLRKFRVPLPGFERIGCLLWSMIRT